MIRDDVKERPMRKKRHLKNYLKWKVIFFFPCSSEKEAMFL